MTRLTLVLTLYPCTDPLMLITTTISRQTPPPPATAMTSLPPPNSVTQTPLEHTIRGSQRRRKKFTCALLKTTIPAPLAAPLMSVEDTRSLSAEIIGNLKCADVRLDFTLYLSRM